MSKIFMSFFSSYWDEKETGHLPCFYESFIRGMSEYGNEFLVYISRHHSMDYDDIPDKLLKQIKDFSPECCFLFNNNFYDISKYLDCPIFIYDVDSPLFFSNRENLKQNSSRYKFITGQNSSAKMIQELFHVKKENILQIPFFTEIKNTCPPPKYCKTFVLLAQNLLQHLLFPPTHVLC